MNNEVVVSQSEQSFARPLVTVSKCVQSEFGEAGVKTRMQQACVFEYFVPVYLTGLTSSSSIEKSQQSPC